MQIKLMLLLLFLIEDVPICKCATIEIIIYDLFFEGVCFLTVCCERRYYPLVMFFDHFCRCCVVRLPNFHGIVTSFEQYPRDWNLWYTSSEPENTPLPGNQELFIR